MFCFSSTAPESEIVFFVAGLIMLPVNTPFAVLTVKLKWFVPVILPFAATVAAFSIGEARLPPVKSTSALVKFKMGCLFVNP